MTPPLVQPTVPLGSDDYQQLATRLWTSIRVELIRLLELPLPPESCLDAATCLTWEIGSLDVRLMQLASDQGISFGLSLYPFGDRVDGTIHTWSCFNDPMGMSDIYVQAIDLHLPDIRIYTVSLNDPRVNNLRGNDPRHPDLVKDIALTTAERIIDLHQFG